MNGGLEINVRSVEIERVILHHSGIDWPDLVLLILITIDMIGTDHLFKGEVAGAIHKIIITGVIQTMNLEGMDTILGETGPIENSNPILGGGITEILPRDTVKITTIILLDIRIMVSVITKGVSASITHIILDVVGDKGSDFNPTLPANLVEIIQI